MKKILLIPSLLTIGVTPIVSLVGCKPKDPEPEYIEVELIPHPDTYNSHRSGKFNLEAGKKYKFIIESIAKDEDNFYFADATREQDYDVDVEVEKVLDNGKELTESVDYEIGYEYSWGITNWNHDVGTSEIYLIVNETTNNVYAWSRG